MFGVSHSTNESPVRNERPVNKQSATNEIFLRDRSPVAAVVAVVTVVAHCEIAVLRNLKRSCRIGKILLAGPVTAVSVFRAHHPLETVAFGRLIVRIKKWRLNPQRIVR